MISNFIKKITPHFLEKKWVTFSSTNKVIVNPLVLDERSETLEKEDVKEVKRLYQRWQNLDLFPSWVLAITIDHAVDEIGNHLPKAAIWLLVNENVEQEKIESLPIPDFINVNVYARKGKVVAA